MPSISICPGNEQYGEPVHREVYSHEREHGRLLAAGDTESIWGWGTVAGRRRAERRAGLVARGAELGPGMRALEVGCGTGNFTAMFAESGAEVVAVDISAELLDLARHRNLPPERVTFLCKPFEECAVHGPFDAVIGSSILHHLNVEASLGKIFGLLRPGGWMSFAEPNLLNPQVYAERRFRHWKRFWYVSEDEIAFVRSSFARKLIACGFTDVCIMPFDWLHPATPVAAVPVVSALGRLVECLPGVREFAGSLWIRARRPLST